MKPPLTIPSGFPTEDCRKLSDLCAEAVGVPASGEFLSISPALFIAQANTLLPAIAVESGEPKAVLQESAQLRWHGRPICDQPLLVNPLTDMDEAQKGLQLISTNKQNFDVHVTWRLREVDKSRIPDLMGMRRRSVPSGEKVVECDGISEETIGAYLELTGDENPIHSNFNTAHALGFRGAVVPGFFLLGCAEIALSAAFNLKPPQSLTARFVSPIVVGDTIKVTMSTAGGSGRIRAQILDAHGRVAALVDVFERLEACSPC